MIQNSVKLNKVLSPHHMLNSLLLWWFQLLIIQEIRLFPTFRSSHWRCSVKKGVLRNFAKFTEKHLCESLFLNKVAGLRPATLLKKRLWYRCFPVNFAKFLTKPFLKNTSWRLLLKGNQNLLKIESRRTFCGWGRCNKQLRVSRDVLQNI